ERSGEMGRVDAGEECVAEEERVRVVVDGVERRLLDQICELTLVLGARAGELAKLEARDELKRSVQGWLLHGSRRGHRSRGDVRSGLGRRRGRGPGPRC